MALAAGQRIGAYEIVAQLGAGGMGEVYRARDSKLKREVALKVLPADVANDRERLARFQREAEVLASLNHPHIAHVNGTRDLSRYFDPAAILRSMVATVFSHAIVIVAPASVTLTNPMVNCSTEASPARTVIGARSTSNLGS
jgi:serine/threonine protein kinase